MTHVLHVISGLDPRLGGPSRAMVGLLEAQIACGLSVSLLTTWTAAMNDLSLAHRLRQAGVTVRTVGPIRQPLGRHPELKPAVEELVRQADVVHIHALWESVQHFAARTAAQHHKPYLYRPCGMLDPWSLAQRRWAKKLLLAWRVRRDLNAAVALHFTTDMERDLAAPLGLRAPALVEPNGLDLREFEHPPAPAAFRRRFPALGDDPYLIFLSRLHRKKGLELLLPAFARLDHSRLKLVLAGPDEEAYQPRLTDLAQSLGVQDRVIFTGMLQGPERVAALADASLFVLPSYQENFGIAVVEALAAGTPVVITDQVAIHPSINQAHVGGVCPTAVEPLADALKQWLDRKHSDRPLAEQCRQFVRARYDWQMIARRWLNHYQQWT
ncbi:MAG: glycosyltransferase [Phycisphaeraceae bacterium]|nr:glycosyltransferase [Phycisphaeraceae bacterium]